MSITRPAWLYVACTGRFVCPEGTGKTEDAAKDTGKTNFSGKRILLVEDNELNLETATEILKMNGSRSRDGGRWFTGSRHSGKSAGRG